MDHISTFKARLDLVGHDIHASFWGGVSEKHNTQPDGEPYGDCYKCRIVADRFVRSCAEHGIVLSQMFQHEPGEQCIVCDRENK